MAKSLGTQGDITERLALNVALRRCVMPLFRRFNPGRIRIRHHYTGAPFVLHSFKHRGYWFHGRRREASTIAMFRRLVKPGDCVVDVGGHIGYFTLLFANLVGPTGTVFVFEPSVDNLLYLHLNVDDKPNVNVAELALCDRSGAADFFVEELTGQNCSLIENYSVLKANAGESWTGSGVRTVSVPCTTFDDFLATIGRPMAPNVVKIDAEGSEFEILCGMRNTLQSPELVLMVEVTRKHREVLDLIKAHGFKILDGDGNRVSFPHSAVGNIFCVKGCRA